VVLATDELYMRVFRIPPALAVLPPLVHVKLVEHVTEIGLEESDCDNFHSFHGTLVIILLNFPHKRFVDMLKSKQWEAVKIRFSSIGEVNFVN
jgi:hypothetical protein